MTHPNLAIRTFNRLVARRGLRASAVAVAATLAAAAGLRAANQAAPVINPTAPAGTAGGNAAASAGQTEFARKAAQYPAGDLSMWGGTPHRNMVSAEKNAPTEWDVESKKNIKWVAKLGSKAY